MPELMMPIALQGSPDPPLISQGAEAKVWAIDFLGRPSIVKQRFSKAYRHPELDNTLTTQRLKAELRCMIKARKLGVLTAVPYHVETSAASIYMERIQGCCVKEALLKGELDQAALQALVQQIGKVVACLHDGGLIHGDLTTSNMMIRSSDSRLVLIDFGLAYYSKLPEDKGVDLYVLERALGSTHSDKPGLFKKVLEEYRQCSSQYSATFNRFAEVRLRGRKRTMVG